MAKRTRRPSPAQPASSEAARPTFPTDRHSGEGSASALEILQKLEKRRGAARPADPGPDDDPLSNR